MSAQSADIVGVAAGNDDFSTLVTAVKAADLVSALQGDGPYTVFAPNNAAFAKVPSEALAGLLKPENKEALTSVLTYHVVKGKLDAAAVVKAIQDGGGTATLTTLQGGKITAMIEGGQVKLKDENGNISTVIATDVEASNGIIHALDAVVMPGDDK
ncbi:MAG: fasciclin domain-containing protein [Bacteroidota bacterium]